MLLIKDCKLLVMYQMALLVLKYDSVKTSVNSTIGAIRTYMGSKQDNDYNRMIGTYNHYISNLNTTNMNELD